ncbi:metal-dependent transcriptional regulator [Pseudonocardia ailaonensis]|uniref:Metal-dependent transcriptional regulator n=1 Tax=Pseudonocardia ailaonensis TaxID=367279 RepID=A0ABN2MJB8_9PSEU
MKEYSGQARRYLQVVYELAEDGERSTRAEIVHRTRRSYGTVGPAISELGRVGLLDLDDPRTVRLTADGLSVALATTRTHRVLECFLADVVGLDWALLHTEALRWQRVVSAQAEARISALLGDDPVSPFGSPIPTTDDIARGGDSGTLASIDLPLLSYTVDLRRRPTALRRLVQVPNGARLRITRVTEDLQSDPTLLRELSRTGLIPGRHLDGVRRRPDGTVEVSTADGAVVEIDQKAARGLRVEPEANRPGQHTGMLPTDLRQPIRSSVG